jgi:hypothetical protein
MAREYWAAKPTDEIIDACKEKIDLYYDWVRASGRLSLWSRVHRQYYAGLIEGGALGTDGDQDELVSMNVNDFRNIIQHLITMTTSQRPEFRARAMNSDHRSQTQTILAEGVLDYVLRQKGLESNIKQVLEASLLFTDSHLVAAWDANSGQDYAVDPGPDVPAPPMQGEGSWTGAPVQGETSGSGLMLPTDGPSTMQMPHQIIKTGDLAFRSGTPLDLARDFTKTDADAHQWYIDRSWQNRYDVAARYPEFADKILSLPTKVDPLKRPRFVNMFVNLYRYETEDIEVWTFYHDRSDAIPDGRMTVFIEPDMVLFDGPLPFDEIPVYIMSAAYMLGTHHGYSPAYDLLSLQEAENATWSTIASNIATFGVQNVMVPEGSNIDVNSLGGLKVIKYDSKLGPPQALQLTQNAPETYQFLDRIIHAAETVSGVNSVKRGNPEASLKSGSALALVDAKSLEFSIGLQQSYVSFVESVATGIVKMYRRYAKAPQTALIAGVGNKSFVQEFTGSDLDQIDRVAVELENPLMRTTAGRVQIAELLGQKNLLKTPEEYIQVLTTGRLEPVLEATQKEMLAIKAENERLAGEDGMPVNAIISDNHPAHLREHAAVAATPDARDNPQLLQRVFDHQMQHVQLWETIPPPLAMALNIPPPPPMPMGPPGAPPGAGPGPAQAPPLPPGKVPPANIAANMELHPSTGPQPKQPNQPINPQTNERAPGAPTP